ncbi:GIY-YIG nuclease family protein, partial [Flavobacterium sp.]
MYFVYVIYSLKLDNYYVGTTDNVEKRLQEHNLKVYADSFTC